MDELTATLAIDKESPVPLYHQIRQALERMISDGVYKTDDYIPSEKELCEMFDVSRPTVRQTISEMLDDGLIYRKNVRGRLQVAPAKVQQRLNRLEGFFTEDMLTAGLQPNVKLLSLELVENERINKILGIHSKCRVFMIKRLHEGGGVPLALQTSYIPELICPDLDRKDLSKSIFKIIEHSTEKAIVRAVQKIHFKDPDYIERSLLSLPVYTPAYQVTRVSYTSDGTAVEYFDCLLRGDRFDFTMELTMDNR